MENLRRSRPEEIDFYANSLAASFLGEEAFGNGRETPPGQPAGRRRYYPVRDVALNRVRMGE
jgi:hypothetical protein